ncbi:MAG: AMP-binding protein, partial [Burkholderiaceae bacterium]|nr:AMP-binding protein [Burkholderiaceae bacterium]
MSRLHRWASETPDKLALIESEGGTSLTFAELDDRVQRASAWLISEGYEAGDSIMLLLENRAEIVELGMAARRTGLYFVVVSTHLAPPELAHIVRDSGARMLIVSDSTVAQVQPLCAQLPEGALELVCVGADAHGLVSYEACLAAANPRMSWVARSLGRDMLYSSGTTGFPKGVRRALVPPERRDDPEPEVVNWQKTFGFDGSTVYLSPAPLYHAAPLRYVMRTVEVGGTVVMMRKFNPREALALIARHGVTHSQWVPTMFVRMLEIPESERAVIDIRTMRVAIHAAAPCPPHVKEAML